MSRDHLGAMLSAPGAGHNLRLDLRVWASQERQFVAVSSVREQGQSTQRALDLVNIESVWKRPQFHLARVWFAPALALSRAFLMFAHRRR